MYETPETKWYNTKELRANDHAESLPMNNLISSIDTSRKTTILDTYRIY